MLKNTTRRPAGTIGRMVRRLPVGMLVFWSFLALCVGYTATKMSIGMIVIADDPDAARFLDTQTAWAAIGLMLLYGLVSSAITEWVARS